MNKMTQMTSQIGKQFKKIDSGMLVIVLDYDADTDTVRLKRRDGSVIFRIIREEFIKEYIETTLFPNQLADSGEREQKDMVNHPPHYKQGKIEIIDFIEDQKLNYHLSSVIKYVCRSPHKGSQIEDLQKAAWYLNREINNLQMQVVPDWDNPTTKQGEIK